jgi:hypothetical protein
MSRRDALLIGLGLTGLLAAIPDAEARGGGRGGGRGRSAAHGGRSHATYPHGAPRFAGNTPAGSRATRPDCATPRVPGEAAPPGCGAAPRAP